MSSSYSYRDDKFLYIDPKTGLLRNLMNISDESTLILVESGFVIKRLKELKDHPIKIVGTISLLEIHRFLFSDLYEWAGEIREVEITKDGKQFFPINSFDTASLYIDSLIVKYRAFPIENLKEISKILAEILDHVNYLHPFREGNGRVQREFIRLLAEERGLKLNLTPMNDFQVYKEYMEGTVNSNIELLQQLFYRLLKKS